MKVQSLIITLVAGCALSASASSFTTISPTGGALPSGISPLGGIVTDLTGANGVRVTAQVSAASEFKGDVPGYTGSGSKGSVYLNFGQQGGVTQNVVSALGGGISAASFRITLYDGDSQAGNFDYNQDFLYVGAVNGAIGSTATTSTGTNFGNFSSVTTERTDSMGNSIGSQTLGFGNNILDTGFFSSTDPAALSSLYNNLVTASLTNQTLNFELLDKTYGDQYYDFTQGIDASLIDINQNPTVAVTPEPSAMLLTLTGVLAVVAVGLRQRRIAAA